MRALVGVLILVVLAGAGGCRTRLGDLTLATAKNVPARLQLVQTEVLGRECGHSIALIPFGTLNPSIEGAIDDALSRAAGADALSDVSFYQDLVVTGIYNRVCARVRGTAVRTR